MSAQEQIGWLNYPGSDRAEPIFDGDVRSARLRVYERLQSGTLHFLWGYGMIRTSLKFEPGSPDGNRVVASPEDMVWESLAVDPDGSGEYQKVTFTETDASRSTH